MKRKIAWLCMITTLISVLAPQVTYANVDKGKTEAIIEIEKNEKISDISVEELNATDMLVLNQEEYKNQSTENMKEVLDNGTNILVTGAQESEIKERFENFITIEANEESIIAGYLIESNGNNYILSPIEYSLMLEEGMIHEVSEKEKRKMLSEILETDTINPVEILNRSANWEGINLNELDDMTVVKLQEGVNIVDAYTQVTSYAYLYIKNIWYTIVYDAQYKSASGYTKIGMLDFLMYVIDKGTKGVNQYDLIVGQCRAGGMNGGAVQEFDVGISVASSNDEKLVIADYAREAKVTGTTTTFHVQTTIEAITTGYTTSYSYESGDLNSVEEVSTERNLARAWKCKTPMRSNGVFLVKPSIFLLNTDGRNTPVTAVLYVDYFKVSYGLATYVCEKSRGCSISFCDHEEYSY